MNVHTNDTSSVKGREEVVLRGVMITGATTPIGEALVDVLRQDPRIGHVMAVAREPRGLVASALFDDPKVSYQEVDLTRSRQLRRLLYGPVREQQIEAVIHMAMHRSAGDSGKQVHSLNVESTRHLLELAERHPTIKRFVFRSFGAVYKIRADLPNLLKENHPLALDGPQWRRDRVEADLTVCAHMGLSPLHIVVLRCAECLAPSCGSQLHDYLSSRVCFRPLGYDPMLNLLSVKDMAEGLFRALFAEGQGVFNLPGWDTLPLSCAIAQAGRREVPVPEMMLPPLYWLRKQSRGRDFRYDLNHWRFHYNGVLDGSRAATHLNYRPQHAIDWPSL